MNLSDLCEDEIIYILEFSPVKIINSICQINGIYKKIVLHYLLNLINKGDLLMQAVDNGCLTLVKILLLDEMKIDEDTEVFTKYCHKYPKVLKELLSWCNKQKYFNVTEEIVRNIMTLGTIDMIELLFNVECACDMVDESENLIKDTLARNDDNIMELLINHGYGVDIIEVACREGNYDLCEYVFEKIDKDLHIISFMKGARAAWPTYKGWWIIEE